MAHAFQYKIFVSGLLGRADYLTAIVPKHRRTAKPHGLRLEEAKKNKDINLDQTMLPTIDG